MLRCWRRLDQPGLELARIDATPDGVTVNSTLVDGGRTPFSLHYSWLLDPDWRTRKLRIDFTNAHERTVTIERAGDDAWRIDGKEAPHLNGCI